MIVHASAVVLKTIPYSDSSLISRCFTLEKGKIGFLDIVKMINKIFIIQWYHYTSCMDLTDAQCDMIKKYITKYSVRKDRRSRP